MHTLSCPITPKHCNLKQALSGWIRVTGNCNLQCFVVVLSSSNQCNSCLLPAVTQELLFTAVWPRGSVYSAFSASFLFPPVCFGHSRGSVIPGAGTVFPCWCFGRAEWTTARPRGLCATPAPAFRGGTGTAGPLRSHPAAVGGEPEARGAAGLAEHGKGEGLVTEHGSHLPV